MFFANAFCRAIIRQIHSTASIRTDYINALETARRGGGARKEAFDRFIAECEIEAQKDYCCMFQITLPKKNDKL